MPLTDARAGELARLVEAATPGPWAEVHGKNASFVRKPSVRSSDVYCIARCDRWIDEAYGPTTETSKANAALVVAAVNSLPALLAERAALREALEPFAAAAECADGAPDDMPMNYALYDSQQPTIGDLHRARAALENAEG